MWRAPGQMRWRSPIATEFARLVEKERTEDVAGTSGKPQLSGDPVRQINPEATTGGELAGFAVGTIVTAPPIYDPGGPICVIDDFAVADSGSGPRSEPTCCTPFGAVHKSAEQPPPPAGSRRSRRPRAAPTRIRPPRSRPAS